MNRSCRKRWNVIHVRQVWLLLLAFLCLTGCGDKVSGKISKARILFQIDRLHNGDAKFFGDYVVTNVDGVLTLYNKKGELVRQLDQVSVNWRDCDFKNKLIVYANRKKQLGVIKLDKDLNIISNDILLQSENLNIDSTICSLPDGTYYITSTEIQGNVNNGDASQENGIYTVKLYKTRDFKHLDYVTNIVQEKANIEDGDLNCFDGKFYFTYEKELLDKGKSSINVSVAENMDAATWSRPVELLEADSDHEPAVFWKDEKGYKLYYSSDKEDPGMSYSAGKIYEAYYDDKLRLKEEKEDFTETESGILLYDVAVGEEGLYVLYAKDYLGECDLVAEIIEY